MRICVNRGQPFGDEIWTDEIADRHGLRYTMRPVGRPRKEQSPDHDRNFITPVTSYSTWLSCRTQTTSGSGTEKKQPMPQATLCTFKKWRRQSERVGSYTCEVPGLISQFFESSHKDTPDTPPHCDWHRSAQEACGSRPNHPLASPGAAFRTDEYHGRRFHPTVVSRPSQPSESALASNNRPSRLTTNDAVFAKPPKKCPAKDRFTGCRFAIAPTPINCRYCH